MASYEIAINNSTDIEKLRRWALHFHAQANITREELDNYEVQTRDDDGKWHDVGGGTQQWCVGYAEGLIMGRIGCNAIRVISPIMVVWPEERWGEELGNGEEEKGR